MKKSKKDKPKKPRCPSEKNKVISPKKRYNRVKARKILDELVKMAQEDGFYDGAF